VFAPIGDAILQNWSAKIHLQIWEIGPPFFKVVEASKNIETSIFSIFGVLENQKHRIFDVFLKKVKNKRFLRAPGAYHFS
jgi:hypothetical protein